ncbi:hypothetical protein A2924_03870 [Candidatus Giovannonibacteria bacterium RIFCSPLOWO2_01_FULL_44_16]|uniref:Uncharacterized protein n=1 Tax=Candidatus Giovannonibacteria bacterium RIFCSPLOWO2_01_FULL_44_16 TaxID=1798348 RepID=A0A1F5X5F8_9BACT|nr:MAG: hypothetical protein A2924_03870 [Candidatus Giovannonibacteria bacterium RIFCSPLOWO2_01_FULL_44_16]
MPGLIPCNASNPGQVVCCGCGPEAGRQFLVSLFINWTASPTLIVISFGENPDEVISTFTVLPETAVGVGIGEGAAVGVGLPVFKFVSPGTETVGIPKKYHAPAPRTKITKTATKIFIYFVFLINNINYRKIPGR